MDFQLSEEQQMFKRALRAFCEHELTPHAAAVDREGQLPWESVRKGLGLGLFGMTVPEEYGGAGLDAVSMAIALEEVGRVCGSTGLSLAAHNGLCCAPIAAWGTEEQKRRWLPLLVNGEGLGSLALTEPNAGSDLGAAKTTAVRDGDYWVINGSKAWITNAGLAPLIIVFCRTDPTAGHRGFSMIVV